MAAQLPSAAWSQDCQAWRQSAPGDQADGELCQKPIHVITQKMVRFDVEFFFHWSPSQGFMSQFPASHSVDAELSTEYRSFGDFHTRTDVIDSEAILATPLELLATP